VKPWQRRSIGILTLLGGILGAVMATGILLARGNVLEVLICVAFIAYYLWGIWCGVNLLRNSSGAVRSAVRHWACQVPTFGSPLIGYFLASGFHLTVWLNFSDLKFGVNFLLGSTFTYSFMEPGKPWYLGVNLFAAAMVWWLASVKRKAAAVEAPEAQVLTRSA